MSWLEMVDDGWRWWMMAGSAVAGECRRRRGEGEEEEEEKKKNQVQGCARGEGEEEEKRKRKKLGLLLCETSLFCILK
jgi:hypothetical protein